MELHRRLIAVILFFALLVSGCSKKVSREAAKDEVSEMEQKIISFNLANYAESGFKKWELKGDSANILSDIIYLTNIIIDTYDKPQLKLTSEEGSYDKKERIVSLTEDVVLTTSEGLRLTADYVEWNGVTDVVSTNSPVRIERSDVVATGLGAKAITEMKRVMLNKDVKVMLLQDAMGGVPLELEKDESDEDKEFKATITCDGPLEIDYENNIAVFKNNVKVDDKRGQIYASRMDAYLDPVSKSIVKVVAQGNVKVVRDEDSTYSEKAIYTTADQRIVLLGEPRILIHPTEEVEKIEQDIKGTKEW